MQAKSLLVIAVDGLRASALGAYGNTTYPTPSLDQLASESVVFDHYLVDSSDIDQVASALWTGRHPAHPEQAGQGPPLGMCARRQGVHTHVVTDEAHLADLPSAADWDEMTLVQSRVDRPAADVAETQFAEVLATALDVVAELSSRSQSALVWVNLRGMEAPWDAPPELALALRDEDDPEWPAGVEVPRQATEPGSDQAFIAGCRYAGQMAALDQCLGGFLAELTGSGLADRWDLLFMGLRGFPLGEHGSIGMPVPYEEQLHVPLCYRRADGVGRLTREARLQQPCDVYHWLAQIPQFSESLVPRGSRAVSIVGEALAVATPEWRAIIRANEQGPEELELYVAPDDRWQANNVASRCPQEVEEFQELARRLRTAAGWQDLMRPTT